MNTLLTPENASHYIGHKITFTYNQIPVTRTLLRVSETGKTIYVDHPETRNCLQLVTRKIYVLAKETKETKETKEDEYANMIFPVFEDYKEKEEPNSLSSGYWSDDHEEDGETYNMCTGTCGRVCHYEDTDGEGMCGKCSSFPPLRSKKLKENN
jgi:hypothetical protein